MRKRKIKMVKNHKYDKLTKCLVLDYNFNREKVNEIIKIIRLMEVRDKLNKLFNEYR
jgi:hypothetical protein